MGRLGIDGSRVSNRVSITLTALQTNVSRHALCTREAGSRGGWGKMDYEKTYIGTREMPKAFSLPEIVRFVVDNRARLLRFAGKSIGRKASAICRAALDATPVRARA